MSEQADRLINADKMYQALIEAGNVWGDSKAAYTALDAASKSVLSEITRDEEGSSRVEKEQSALRSKRYTDYMQTVQTAHRTFLRAQVKYDSLRTLIELRRSEESSRRAEMRL